MNGLISTKDTFDWLHICLNNKKNLYVQSGITGMIGMTGISGKLGISDIIIPRWYKSFPGPLFLFSIRPMCSIVIIYGTL